MQAGFSKTITIRRQNTGTNIDVDVFSHDDDGEVYRVRETMYYNVTDGTLARLTHLVMWPDKHTFDVSCAAYNTGMMIRIESRE